MLFITILVPIGLIALDQLFKWLAVQYLAPIGTAPFIPGILQFAYVENTGAAFSILQGQRWLLIAVTGIALLVLAYILVFRRPKGKLEYAALLLIFAGGVGNLIDRIANGFVVDYLSFMFVEFAVFNFADVLVVVGFALVILAVIRAELRERRKAKAQAAAGVPAEAGGDAEPEATGKADGED